MWALNVSRLSGHFASSQRCFESSWTRTMREANAQKVLLCPATFLWNKQAIFQHDTDTCCFLRWSVVRDIGSANKLLVISFSLFLCVVRNIAFDQISRYSYHRSAWWGCELQAVCFQSMFTTKFSRFLLVLSCALIRFLRMDTASESRAQKQIDKNEDRMCRRTHTEKRKGNVVVVFWVHARVLGSKSGLHIFWVWRGRLRKFIKRTKEQTYKIFVFDSSPSCYLCGQNWD